jgi:hypothetical protein
VPTNSEQLEAAFLAAFSFDAEEGQTAFEKFLDDNATVIDDDQTNILDKAGWLDHFEIVHYDIESQIIGETGVVTSNYTIRGKPVDDGFRLRHGVCSASCYLSGDGDWKAMSVVLGPMMSYVRNASSS